MYILALVKIETALYIAAKFPSFTIYDLDGNGHICRRIVR